jgi:hypothetical protein
VAIDLEGTEICDWLNSLGINGCVVENTACRPDRKRERMAESPQALKDAQRTLGLVRHHAADWHIDPHKIGVIWLFRRRTFGGCDEHALCQALV